jgi:Predicted pyridoxal phosphate-dependent enzyme apparently involved in regulation of cell wall biogenesis
VKPNDEVLMPALTFIATANAVSYTGAIPHFIDVSEKSLGVDPQKLDTYLEKIAVHQQDELINKETGRVIRAVVPMHTFGHPVELDELMSVCDKYGLILIEDAAESLGSYYKGKHTGSFGKVNAMSFNGNKIATTGGGGAILTDDEALADYAKHLTTTAKVPHRWEYVHDEIGYNYRMPNINAALGCAQLEKVPQFIKMKRDLTNYYQHLIKNIDGVQLFTEPAYASSNYWLQTLLLDKTIERDEVLAYLNDYGVMSRPIWQPMHYLQMYKNCPRSDLSVIEDLNKRVVNVPSTPY